MQGSRIGDGYEKDGNKLTLQVKINLSGSMLQVEEAIQNVSNEIGA